MPGVTIACCTAIRAGTRIALPPVMNTTMALDGFQMLGKLVADAVCGGCKGSGKRGRGTCSACRGAGIADLTHPRIRFNSGYHDAAAELRGGYARTVIDRASESTSERTVVRNAYPGSWWYAAGYEAGLAAQARGTYAGNSDAAWAAYVAPARDTNAGQYATLMGGWL